MKYSRVVPAPICSDVLQQLKHFLFRLNVLALVVRDDVKALPESFLDAVFVVFDAGHSLSSSLQVVWWFSGTRLSSRQKLDGAFAARNRDH